MTDVIVSATCATCGNDGDCPDCAPHAICDECGETLREEGLRYCRSCRADLAAEQRLIEFDNRNPMMVELSADNVPTDNPDIDSTPETEGPSPLRRPRCACEAPATVPVYIAGKRTDLCSACYERAFTFTAHPVCHCGAIATIWDERYFCSAHYLELPSPTLYCASCLCIADDLGEGRWRCRNLACGSVARLDDLLTTSELIKRRAALERIKVAVFARLKALPDIALGRELCALRWQKFSSFVAMLVNAPEARLQHYARCYVAFVRDYNPESDLIEARVLREWQRLIDGDGPAAPALGMAA